MGRAPCCDKANVKKGPWSPEEDAKLKDYIERCGPVSNWIALPQKIGLKRCGKSCRLRWLNYLRPNIKHGGFSEEEEHIICSLYISIGSRWSIIAAQLPGRTDNDIKNYWNTRLKKKLLGKQRKEQAARNRVNSLKQKEMMKMNTSVDNNFIMVAASAADNKILMNNTSTTTTYSPMMPAALPPVSYQPIQDLGGDDSIKKLLIKLGGRFSDDGYDHQCCSTLDIPPSSSSQQFYENYSSMNLLVSSTSTTHHHPAAGASMMINNSSSLNTNIHDHQFLLQNNNHYDIDGVAANLHMLQGVLNTNDHFPIDVDEQMAPYSENPTEQRLEGLDDECFYEVINNGSNSTNTTTTRTNSSESCSHTWLDNMASLVYPSLVPNDYDPQQQDAGLPQECDFEDSSYLGRL